MKLRLKSTEFYLLLLVCLASVAANLPKQLVSGIINQRLLLIVLAAVVVIALFRYLRLLLFLCVTTLAVGANLPDRLSEALGISPFIMLLFLILIVGISLVNRFLKLPAGYVKDTGQKLDTEETRKAILIAINIGNIKRLRWLISQNMEFNFLENGVAPILLASEKGNSEIVQLLIYHGVDLTVTNSEGKTAFDVAQTLGFSRCAEIIKFALENRAVATGQPILTGTGAAPEAGAPAVAAAQT